MKGITNSKSAVGDGFEDRNRQAQEAQYLETDESGEERLTEEKDGEDIKMSLMENLEEIQHLLPDTLKRVIAPFDSTEEKVMVLAATIVLSGVLLPNIWFTYDSRKTYVMLMMMFVAPPASGKGVLRYPKRLLKLIVNELDNNREKGLQRLRVVKEQNKRGENELLPQLPPLLLIPGNSTSAAIIKQLKENGPDNPIIIYELEADAYGVSASRGEFGMQNSTILRSLFHSESISQLRKTDAEYLHAEEPKGVVILSGTESQIRNIFKSNQDGLFSRFMFIVIDGADEFHDVFQGSATSYDDYFDRLAPNFYNIWNFFKGKDVEVKFTERQKWVINDFGKRHYELAKTISKYASSIALRHTNMMARIAVTLRMMHYYERGENDLVVSCEDDNLSVARWMAELSFHNSLKLFKKLPGEKIADGNGKKNEFWAKLPYRFKVDAIKVFQKELGIPDRTLYRWLDGFVKEGLLGRISHGEYQKFPWQKWQWQNKKMD